MLGRTVVALVVVAALAAGWLAPRVDAQGPVIIRGHGSTGARGALVTHANALLVELSSGSLTVGHITSVTHVAGAMQLRNQAGTLVTVTGTALDVNCTGCSAASVVNVGHVSGVTHVVLTSGAGTAATFTGTSLNVNCTGCSAASVVSVSHVASVTHVAAAGPLPVVQSPQGGVWPVTAHQGGVWNIGHISSTLHLAGNVTDNANSALRVTGVTVFTVQGTIGHVSSTTHVIGSMRIINQAGTVATMTGTALDVNCTGCSSASVVAVSHVSSVTHVAAAGPLPVVQSPQGGVWPVTAHQGGIWNVAHVTSVTHVIGTMRIANQAGTLVTVTGTALDVNCTGCAAASVVAVSHIASVSHVVITSGSGTGVALTGTSLNVAPTTSVNTAVNQSGTWTVQAAHQGGQWNVAHISSVVHVAAASPLPVVQSPQGGVWNATAHQGGVWTIAHVTSVTHVAGVVHTTAVLGGGAQVCHSTAAIAQTASGITIHASGMRIWICGVVLVASAAESVSLVAGTGATCGTLTWPLIGAHVAAGGLALAANGGFTIMSPRPVLSTPINTYNVCLLQAGTTARISGFISYGGGN